VAKTIAVFGAGTEMGISVASRLGREGYRVALSPAAANLWTSWSRSWRRTASRRRRSVDLREDIPALVAAIRARFG
jgi:NAD(P)-dependent dehydrogenase (short-subunit alcohol dehydrogenase family)